MRRGHYGEFRIAAEHLFGETALPYRASKKKTPLVELRMPHLFPYCFRLGLFRFRLSYRQRLRLDLSHSYLFLCSDVFCLFGLKGFLDKLCYFTHILSGLETCNDIAITVDQKFGEIPFYIARRTPVGIGSIKYPFKSRA